MYLLDTEVITWGGNPIFSASGSVYYVYFYENFEFPYVPLVIVILVVREISTLISFPYKSRRLVWREVSDVMHRYD